MQEQNDLRRDLNELIELFLVSDEDKLVGNKLQVDRLVAILCDVTDIDLHPALFRDEHATTTSKGRAVSMTTAAQCGEEIMRTQIFMRGVEKAIRDQIELQGSIELLYGGTGPFGLLVIPLLHRFSPDQIQVTLLDIHPESLEALNKVIELLGVSSYIKSMECVDILEWPAPEEAFDVIVSETMMALLRNEPQVSIYRHLAPSLKVSGTLVPEKVILGAWLENTGLSDQPIHLGNFFTLDIDSSLSLARQATPKIECCLDIPSRPNRVVDLKLTTHIQVYKDEWLYDNQCSLNLPLTIRDIEPAEEGGKIRFWYEFTRSPAFAFKYAVSEKALENLEELSAPEECNQLGVPYLKRYWQKHQLIKARRLKQNMSTSLVSEVALERELFETLNLPLHQTLVEVYASRSEEQFCEFVLAKNGGEVTSNQVAKATELVSQI